MSLLTSPNSFNYEVKGSIFVHVNSVNILTSHLPLCKGTLGEIIVIVANRGNPCVNKKNIVILRGEKKKSEIFIQIRSNFLKVKIGSVRIVKYKI